MEAEIPKSFTTPELELIAKNGKRHRVQRGKYIQKDFTEFMLMEKVQNLLRSESPHSRACASSILHH